MFLKGIYYIFFGLLGIIKNKHFSLKTKIILSADYFNLVGKLIQSFVFKKKYNHVYIRAFNYTIYFYSFYTFFYIFNEIFCMAVYPVITPVTTYIDIGSNIGLTILWQHLFNPRLTVIAFEPNGQYRQFLKKNLQVNRINKVKIYPSCLANTRGTAKFYLIDDLIQSLNSGLDLNRKLPHQVITVKTDRLSRFINQPISLVKMDVEGAEYDILTDLFVTKKINLVDKIIYEAHFYNRKQIDGYRITSRQLKAIGTLQSKVNSEYTRANYFKKFSGLSNVPPERISK